MLSEVDISLGIGAIVVSLISWKNPRGIVWIWVAALSYINATIAWRMNLPYAEAITGMGDACFCLAIYFGGRYRWEGALWRIYQTSVAISIFYLAGNIHVFPVIAKVDHVVYAVLLELCNWLALLVIGGTGALQWFGASNVRADRVGNYLRAARMAIRKVRRTPSFLAKAR